MNKTKKDCSPYGAFMLLQDGQWHSKDELRAVCGESGDRRARDLRSDEYGCWTIETKVNLETGVSFYRIPESELKARPNLVKLLNSRNKVVYMAETDHLRSIKLSISELVLLVALLDGNNHLNNPEVHKHWLAVKSQLTARFKAALPAKYTDPYDLFESNIDEQT